MEENFDFDEFEELEEFPTKSSFGSLSRKRKAMRKEHFKLLKLIQDRYFPSGAYYDDEKGYIKRYWRGKRSKQIKKDCNRKFRRSDKYKNLTSKSKNIQRKATEFWWEYD